MAVRILLVEDEATISEPLAEHLERDGFETEVAASLAEARASLEREMPDLILLDVMLPDGDGRDLAREVRRTSDMPIIVLTARGEEIDRVLGLELGADDYVVKPFSARELSARIRAILRRSRPDRRPGQIQIGDLVLDPTRLASTVRSSTTARIQIGDLVLDPTARTVTKEGKPLQLTAREFDLLHLLMAHAGHVVRREQIMDEVWDPHWLGPTKTLDVHISWLRKKLGDDAQDPRYIATVRGVGFRFLVPEAPGSDERG